MYRIAGPAILDYARPEVDMRCSVAFVRVLAIGVMQAVGCAEVVEVTDDLAGVFADTCVPNWTDPTGQVSCPPEAPSSCDQSTECFPTLEECRASGQCRIRTSGTLEGPPMAGVWLGEGRDEPSGRWRICFFVNADGTKIIADPVACGGSGIQFDFEDCAQGPWGYSVDTGVPIFESSVSMPQTGVFEVQATFEATNFASGEARSPACVTRWEAWPVKGAAGTGGVGGTGGTGGIGGTGPADRPTLTDIEASLIDLNECGIVGTSTFRYTVDYSDPDGDVTPAGTRVMVDLVWSNGVTQSYESLSQFNSITGDGFNGSVQAYNCLSFGNASWVAVSIAIEDADENLSNSLTTRIDKPAGAY